MTQLVEIVDKAAESPTQPLVLFGFSFGATAAYALAVHFGARVRKLYVVGARSHVSSTGIAFGPKGTQAEVREMSVEQLAKRFNVMFGSDNEDTSGAYVLKHFGDEPQKWNQVPSAPTSPALSPCPLRPWPHVRPLPTTPAQRGVVLCVCYPPTDCGCRDRVQHGRSSSAIRRSCATRHGPTTSSPSSPMRSQPSGGWTTRQKCVRTCS
jgi:hypothetical protein